MRSFVLSDRQGRPCIYLSDLEYVHVLPLVELRVVAVKADGGCYLALCARSHGRSPTASSSQLHISVPSDSSRHHLVRCVRLRAHHSCLFRLNVHFVAILHHVIVAHLVDILILVVFAVRIEHLLLWVCSASHGAWLHLVLGRPHLVTHHARVASHRPTIFLSIELLLCKVAGPSQHLRRCDLLTRVVMLVLRSFLAISCLVTSRIKVTNLSLSLQHALLVYTVSCC